MSFDMELSSEGMLLESPTVDVAAVSISECLDEKSAITWHISNWGGLIVLRHESNVMCDMIYLVPLLCQVKPCNTL